MRPRTACVWLLLLLGWAGFALPQACAGQRTGETSSPARGNTAQDPGVSALNDSPGLSYDPGPSAVRETSLRSGSTALQSAVASAGGGNDQSLARQGVARGKLRPFSLMLKTIGRAAPGDVVRVKLRQRPHGLWTYDVTVLGADGRYVLLSLNAADGRIMTKTRR